MNPKTLLDAERWDGAYYLAGYAVELALKACIIKTLMATDAFPDKEFSKNCYTHKFKELLKAAKLDGVRKIATDADADLLTNWGLAEKWSEQTRYHRIEKPEAVDFYEAVEDGAWSVQMDQGTLVNEQIENGQRLIDALRAEGFTVRVAFWAKPSEGGSWFLHLASPFVEEQGPAKAYRFVYGVMRRSPDLWIEPLDVKIFDERDSLAEAVSSLQKPRAPGGPFAIPNPKPFPGPTWFGATTLAGADFDGGYIYPQPQSAA